MRNAVFIVAGSLFLFALLPSTLAGCGDSCEDLQEICDRCTDGTYADSCTQTVTDGNQTLCDSRKQVFNEQCPFVLTTSSTTTTTAATGGSGGTPSTGGTGGTAATGGMGGTTGGAGGTAGSGGTAGAGGN